MASNIILIIATSFILCLVITKWTIVFCKRLKIGQNISEDVPKIHLLKEGTPSFGGVAILLSLFISFLIFIRCNPLIFFCFTIIFGYSLIGFLDDYLNLKKQDASLGLKARYKILLQLILSTASALFFYHFLKDTSLFIPFLNRKVDLGYFYIPFVILVFLASTNAVNLTDGLDGLCAGVSIIGLCGFLYFSGISNNFEGMFLCASIIGSLLGFLWFNIHPAKIFMGDTGSLMLGAVFTIVSILTKKELALLIIGGIFVIETLSVIIQVISFKLTKKRVFKMSPLHHHFEVSGWKETKVVFFFWIISVVFTFIGIWIFK